MNNSTSARHKILSNLRDSPVSSEKYPQNITVMKRKCWTDAEKVLQLKSMMEEVHTEVRLCTESDWESTLRTVVKEKGIGQLLYGSKTVLAEQLLNMRQQTPDTMPELFEYEQPIEESKDLLFGIDASITTTRGGIAETGSLILWTTPNEPRLMSLIPPIHIAVLHADTIYNTFWEVVNTEQWNSGMPTNALLISGPSKTADIEQTLVYGVHGCKELVVLLIQ
ncbi:MAG: lactate utilization protein [SAR324 cluster bacterium]